MANIRVSVVSEIAAGPEAVFAVLSDPAQMSEWITGVRSGRWDDGPDARSGGRFHLKYHYGRKTHDLTMEITAVEPGTLFEYHTVEGPYPIEASFKLTASESGTTVSYCQNALSDSKLASLGFILTGWVAKPMMRRTLRRDLYRLGATVKAAGKANR